MELTVIYLSAYSSTSIHRYISEILPHPKTQFKRDKNMNEKSPENKHFVLVHGFCLGAWCWYKLAAALKSNGSRSTAIDLAGCGINPDLLRPDSTFSDYVRPLMDFLASLPDDEKVVLVGHSYGGLPISAAMENFPAKISLAVFVTAYMPNCTDPPATLMEEV